MCVCVHAYLYPSVCVCVQNGQSVMSRLRETSAGKSRLLDRIKNFRVEQTTKQHVTRARKELSFCDVNQVEKDGGVAARRLHDWVLLLLLLLLLLLKCCFTSTETVGLLGTGAQDVHLDFLTAPELCNFKCCFTSTETIRTIRDGEPRTSTSTFTQLLSSDLHHCY